MLYDILDHIVINQTFLVLKCIHKSLFADPVDHAWNSGRRFMDLIQRLGCKYLLRTARVVHVTCDIRDLAILSLLYESGCRVQELIDLKYDDLSLNSPATISVTGKGNKTRIIPISNKVVSILNKYTAIYKISDSTEVLFTNKQAKSLTRSGISYIIKKHSDSARIKNPQIFGMATVHPHVLRHSKAMHLLESGVNLIYIRDFLGHSSVITTEIYAKSNPEIKRKYLENAASNIDISVNKFSEKEKESLLEWLKHNI